MTKQQKLPPKIYAIMLATSLGTFGSLASAYTLLFS